MTSSSSAALLLSNFKTLFDDEKHFSIKHLRQLAWIGDMLILLPESEVHRGLCWRLLLGILPKENNILVWKQKLDQQIIDFEVIRNEHIVKVDQAEKDPLTALSMGSDQSGEWGSFYRDLELQNFLNGDLDRLYMNSIPDEYFQVKSRRDLLLNVLFVWSMRHKSISYRQGMHEIAGTILLVLEQERDGWKNVEDSEHVLKSCFTTESLLPHVYWIFERVMDELQVLYDPEPTKGKEGADLPPIVHFCSKVQEHFLSQLDPDLCQTLESLSIPGQVYGMRWSRLLFSREFPVTHTQCLRIWDYIFATSGDVDEDLTTRLDDQATFELVLKHRYRPYSPMLAAIGDFMMALMIQVREQIVGADCSTVLMLLMRYPPLNDVRPILDKADMIRRGVLPQDAHVHKTESAPPSPHPLSSSSDDPLLRPGAHTGVNGPNWLMSTLPAAVDNIVRVLNANGVFAHTDGSHSTQARTQPPTPAKQQIQQKNSQKVDSADIDSDDGLDDVGDNASAHVNNDKPQYEDPLRFFMSGGSNSSTSAALNKGKDAHVAVESKPSSAVAKQNPKESQINTHVFAGSGKATTPPGKRFGIFNRQRIKDRSTGGAESSAETQTKISQHILDIAATLQTHAISTANLKNTTTAPVTTATITAAIDESTQQLTTSSTANSISSSVSCPDTLILEVIGKLRGLAHVLNGHTTLDLFESFYASGHSTVNPEAVVDTCMLADGSSNSDRASVSDGAEATLTLKDPQSSVPSVQTVKVEPDPLSMQIPLRVAASHVTEEQKY